LSSDIKVILLNISDMVSSIHPNNQDIETTSLSQKRLKKHFVSKNERKICL